MVVEMPMTIGWLYLVISYLLLLHARRPVASLAIRSIETDIYSHIMLPASEQDFHSSIVHGMAKC
jgi:hypothetical protein